MRSSPKRNSTTPTGSGVETCAVRAYIDGQRAPELNPIEEVWKMTKESNHVQPLL